VSPTLTVLMTTYHGTTSMELRRAVASIASQSRPPDELVIVVDGPVPPELDAAIDEVAASSPVVRVERLPRNLGNGPASQRGLELATGDFVARQDSDDVSLPHRLERQLETVREHDLDLLGTALLEFHDDPDQVVGVRAAPVTPEAIAARLRINNPMNHPSVVFRRSLALEVGGYLDVPFHEDYDLWARMLAAGARAENLSEPLVLFNAGDGMLSRRGGWGMLRHEWTMQRRLYDMDVIGPVLLARNLLLRGAFRVIPGRLLAPVYALLFRRSHRGRPVP
jgi:glycosyltransferase involved in cell wall biosynthesis